MCGQLLEDRRLIVEVAIRVGADLARVTQKSRVFLFVLRFEHSLDRVEDTAFVLGGPHWHDARRRYRHFGVYHSPEVTVTKILVIWIQTNDVI